MLSWTSKICKENSWGKFPAIFPFSALYKIITTKQYLENYTFTIVAKKKKYTKPIPRVGKNIVQLNLLFTAAVGVSWHNHSEKLFSNT